ncbi:MAG: dUTP diphosphatase [Patescibacteria group bacterium]|jgi:dUTP pyrophosphatase
MDVPIRRLSQFTPLPEYKTSGACAFDIAVIEEKTLQPNERAIFSTGLVIKVPDDQVLILASRSSNAKKGIVLSNGIGVIDNDHCGPNDQLLLAILNIGNTPYSIKIGERIAQGFFVPFSRATFVEPEEWDLPDRGSFGTTG